MPSPGAVLAAARARRPLLDHLVRTVQRYQADAGDRLASSVTFYWFLSLFPILLIAVYVVRLSLGDGAGDQVTSGLSPYLGMATSASVGDVVQTSAGKAGLIGLVGTLLSGLGWINALRTSIRLLWHQSTDVGNLVVTKVRDVAALVGLFAVIAASVVVSGAATAATTSVLGFLDLSETTGARVLTIGLSYALGFLVDVGIFLYLFVRFSQVRGPLAQLVRGAVFGAVGFELIKSIGAFYIGRTTSKGEATYGTFAVVVGLLLFLNLVSRLILLTAAFVVTAPYDSDVTPSGTAVPQDGAVEGEAPMPDQPARSWSTPEPEPMSEPIAPSVPLVAPVPVAAELPGAQRVVLAAQVLKAAGGVAIAGVGVHLVRTLLRLRR